MKGTAEVVIQVEVICVRCGAVVHVNTRDGVGNIPPVIEVSPCRWCEEEACRASVEEERRRKI